MVVRGISKLIKLIGVKELRMREERLEVVKIRGIGKLNRVYGKRLGGAEVRGISKLNKVYGDILEGVEVRGIGKLI